MKPVCVLYCPRDRENLRAQMRAWLVGCLIVAGLMAPLDLAAQDYPPDVRRGQRVYEHQCLNCHGPEGRGDGLEGKSLKVKPADFHRFRSSMKSDEELLRTIEHGVVFSPMHSWRGQLTDEEMADVVAYIRLFLQQAP